MLPNRFRGLALPIMAALITGAAASPDDADQKALRELEQQITTLKQEVFDEKARLHDLEEAVLRGKIVGSKAYITFDNRAEGFFAFKEAEFYLDGEMIHKVSGEGRKSPMETTLVFDRDVPAGDHKLRVKVTYRGSDKSIYVAFPYLKDHEFSVESKETVPVAYGKTTRVKLVAMDKGYFKQDVSERLFLQMQVLSDWGKEPHD